MYNKTIGSLWVIIGASCYGLLATSVKKASLEGYHISGLIFLQFFFGILCLLLMDKKKQKKTSTSSINSKAKKKLLLFGTSVGLTSCFYYLSLKFIPVSTSIVLLMQTVWMGVALEIFLQRKIENLKIFGSLMVILGTFVALNVFGEKPKINFPGLILGLLSSLSYTATLYASNQIGLDLSPIKRSKYLMFGGGILVLIFWNFKIFTENNFLDPLFLGYGLFLALFGTIFPPIFFNIGFPKTGIGLGSILTSFEIPTSILAAHIVLQEQVLPVQWLGVAIILLSIFLIQWRNLKS
ncbi:MAG: EamA family transporter [Flavobacteriaceae bacterium]|nr:MAG: EamA family transporter [Flavobacteriaceae bacterium]